MKTYDLYSQILASGIQLFLLNGVLRYKAPNGTLTAERREILKTYKEELIEYLKNFPELSTDPPADPLPSYLEALTCRIQALEAEYAAAYGEPAPGEKETCRELSWKTFFPAEQQRKYNERYEALMTIERLKREHKTALAEGRTMWTPGPSDTILQQKNDGSFVPADLDGLDQAAPDSSAEVTAIMGPWNQRLYGKRAVNCTRTAPGVVKRELVGDIPKHEKEIPNGKIFKGTAQSLDGLKKGA